jgi:anaerobic nitric oxide reductase flavorubredoxin
MVKAKIKELAGLNLTIDMIAPSHGIIWRDNPMQIIEKYDQWAGDYQEGTVAILYDSMWGATRKMAQAIAKGLRNKGVGAKLLNTGKRDKNDVITEVFKAKGVIVGSSTINKGMLSSTAEILEIIKGLQFKSKVGAAFGSYGWGGESIKMIENRLRESSIEIAVDGIRVQYNPNLEELKSCETFGESFADHL